MATFARVLIFCVIFTAFGGLTALADNIIVEVHGQRVFFPDRQPVIVENRTLVPVRGVFEALGYTVDWNDATGTAILSDGLTTIRITVGEQFFTLNGLRYRLDVPAQLIDNRMMLPIRALVESIGLQLHWSSHAQVIRILYPLATLPVFPAAHHFHDDILRISEAPSFDGTVQLIVVTGHAVNYVWVNFDRDTGARASGRFADAVLSRQDADTRTWVAHFRPEMPPPQEIEIARGRVRDASAATFQPYEITVTPPPPPFVPQPGAPPAPAPRPAPTPSPADLWFHYIVPQTFVVSGYTTYSGAIVRLIDARTDRVMDWREAGRNGFFEFRNVRPGRHIIEVSLDGHTTERHINVNYRDIWDLYIRLRPR